MREPATIELYLEGCTGPVLWQEPEAYASPPRVVIYADTVWQFYRFRGAKIRGHRAATYKRVEPLRLAPGEYS